MKVNYPWFNVKSLKPFAGKFRKIVTELPVSESCQIIETLKQYETESLQWQPPVVWHKAQGFQIFDKYGNIWIDWTSGIQVTNLGHGRSEIREKIIEEAKDGLLFAYCFPTENRASLVKKLVEITPSALNRVSLLTTGSEAVEQSIKIASAYAMSTGGSDKNIIISFHLAFHGRTMGAQLVSGYEEAKDWIHYSGNRFIQIPFPDGFRNTDTDFSYFLSFLELRNVIPKNVAAVLMEPYQGSGASFAPVEYVKKLRKWCSENDILLIFDEAQSGFGRTGKLFAFEHYNVIPDMLVLAKAITNSLPLSAIIGRGNVMNILPPGALTSTHGGNSLCCAVALKSIEIFLSEGITKQVDKVGEILKNGLEAIRLEFSAFIGVIHGRGLVYGVHVTLPNSKSPNRELAIKVVDYCYRHGLLLFGPIGFGESIIKICPPLIISEEALRDGLTVLRDAFYFNTIDTI